MTPMAHRRYLPEPKPESRRHLLLAAIVLAFTCAAFYALIVGLGG